MISKARKCQWSFCCWGMNLKMNFRRALVASWKSRKKKEQTDKRTMRCSDSQTYYFFIRREQRHAEHPGHTENLEQIQGRLLGTLEFPGQIVRELAEAPGRVGQRSVPSWADPPMTHTCHIKNAPLSLWRPGMSQPRASPVMWLVWLVWHGTLPSSSSMRRGGASNEFTI